MILATGVLVISTIDNLLRPILIGQDVEMHPLLIFLSTLEGSSSSAVFRVRHRSDHRVAAPGYLGDVRSVFSSRIQAAAE